MLADAEQQLATILEGLADALDVPPSRYEEAVRSYEALGEWLGAEGSALQPYAPKIYSQGSFRLGTAIKPVTENDEYDVDLVCRLEMTKESVTQAKLKEMVGERLRENETYKRMLKEGRRCWTLEYANSAKFHMDILPAIPDVEGLPEAILITDTELRLWQHSNPKGFAEWFKQQMVVRFLAARRILAAAERCEVEEIPEYKVRTPLQRAVQILKRHRDIHFQKDPSDKPSSIVITTLAAKAYRNEEDLYQALQGITGGMGTYIESRNGVIWIPNPVNPKENFADKWREHPQRHTKFLAWMKIVRADLEKALELRGR